VAAGGTIRYPKAVLGRSKRLVRGGHFSKEDNMRVLSAAWIILLMTGTQVTFAEPSVNDLAPRTEVHANETLTLSDQQLLTGDKNGQRVTIAGELRFPRGTTGRLPAVILLHGSGGIGAREEFWSKYLSELGVASFLVDSFAGRGIVQTSTDQAQLGRLATILDGYRAFDVLAGHPRIDSSRIALMGFSRGGTATPYASMTRLRDMWNPRANFAAYIPLYASCSATLIGDTDISTTPLRQFHGMADDWVTVAPCRPYFERLQAAGRDVKLTEYPDAHHSYDNPLGSITPTVSKDAQSTRDCLLKEEPRGIIINVKSGQRFSYKDPCVVLDPHTGYNEAAAVATRNEVAALLKVVFKL
jgi:dienelactone hydrolase